MLDLVNYSPSYTHTTSRLQYPRHVIIQQSKQAASDSFFTSPRKELLWNYYISSTRSTGRNNNNYQ